MSRNHSLDIVGFTTPELHTGKCWYIDYYVQGDAAGGTKPVRHRIKLNKPKDLIQRRARARVLIEEITGKLRRGWRPSRSPEAPKAHYTLGQAVEAYLAAKLEELSLSSPQYYKAWVKSFRSWAVRVALWDKQVDRFTKADALAYMDHLSMERKVGPRTWNNYRIFQAGMFNWLVGREYRASNPFKGIPLRKVRKKTRVFIDQEVCARITRWASAQDPEFYLVLLYVYHTLLRPRELARVRVHMVDLDNQVVHLPAEITKNGEEAFIAIPNVMVPYLEASGLRQGDPDWFVMGTSFRPGPKAAHKNSYHARWNKLRKALRLPMDHQLYSLRDTGIIQLLRDGCDLLHVRQQARHKDIRTTNEYLKHAFPRGLAEVREKATALGGGA